jgi:hypothetical protein
MAIIWFVLLMSQFALLGVAYTIAGDGLQKNVEQGFLGAYPPVVFGAIMLAVSNLLISFFMRRRCNEQAVAEQNTKYVQTGLVIACAFCESISIIGMVLAVAFAYPYFYIWFASAFSVSSFTSRDANNSSTPASKINYFFGRGNLFSNCGV